MINTNIKAEQDSHVHLVLSAECLQEQHCVELAALLPEVLLQAELV